MNVLASTYIHALEGRLRVRLPKIKRAAIRARELESHLQQFPGVEYVSANPTTGSVLILYEPGRIAEKEILTAIMDLGYLSQSIREGGMTESGSAMARVTTSLAVTLVEAALRGVVSVLI